MRRWKGFFTAYALTGILLVLVAFILCQTKASVEHMGGILLLIYAIAAFCGGNDFRGTKQEQTLSDGRILWFFVFSLYLWHQRYMESQFIWYVSHDFDNTSGLCHGRNAGGNALSAQKRGKLTKRKS